ncbi:MAG: DUF6484 domain-containing protein [Rhodocyclaceae bacterium]
MNRAEDPFIAIAAETLADSFPGLEEIGGSATALAGLPPWKLATAPAVGRLQGFDLLDQPLISNLSVCPGEVVPARSTLPLRRGMIGSDVVVLFDGGDPQAPIVMGVIERKALVEDTPAPAIGVTVQADGERHVIEAEREIVLRCGDASITLTRAGKVLIKGNYIVSRSSGCNKVKGAAIELN